MTSHRGLGLVVAGALALVVFGAQGCSSGKPRACIDLCACDSTKCAVTDENECKITLALFTDTGLCKSTSDAGGGDGGDSGAGTDGGDDGGTTCTLPATAACGTGITGCCADPLTCYYLNNPNQKQCCSDNGGACSVSEDCCQGKSSLPSRCMNSKCCVARGYSCTNSKECCPDAPNCDTNTGECSP